MSNDDRYRKELAFWTAIIFVMGIMVLVINELIK